MNWLVGAALILLLSLIFDLGLLAYAMYALLSVLLVSRYLTRHWADSLVASRECNRLTANVGEQVAVVVTIENRGKFSIPWCLVEDLLPRRALIHEPPNLGVAGGRMQLLTLARGARKAVMYQLHCNRRGYYQLGPLVLETGDLFGLHRRYKIATDPHFLLVFPQVVLLEGYDISSKRPIGEVRMSYRLYEDPTRIAGVRRYEAGDPLNRVHWKATARTGLLHSKVYEPSTVAGVTLLMDYHVASHDPRHEPYRSELAVTAAASIANAIYEMGQQVGLISNGRDAADRIRTEGWDLDLRSREAARSVAAMSDTSERLRPLVVPTRRGADQFVQLLEALARLELSDGLTLFQLIEETQSRMPRDATVIAVLPAVRPEHAIALTLLKQQGFAVTAVLNVYEEYEFAQASGPLLSVGIPTHHLRDDQAVAHVCRRLVLR